MRTMVLAAAAILCPLALCAADDIKPFDAKLGLWESTSTTDLGGASPMSQIPPDRLAAMTPQQRAQLEAVMKARGGLRTNTVKFCVTPETLSRGLSMSQRENACTRKVVSSSASKQEIHLDCSQASVPMTGDVTIERLDAEHVKGAVAMKSASADRPMQMKSSFNAKWIAADCGDVKPITGK